MNKIHFFSWLTISLLLSGLSLKAQECNYYPVHTGASFGYQSLDGKGKETGSSKVTFLEVITQGSDVTYKVRSENWDDHHKSLGSNDYSMKCENGEFKVDMKSFIDPKSLSSYNDMEVSFTGTDISYPSNLAVGQSLPDADVVMGAASGGMTLLNMTIRITNRKVEAMESVTVPAGTFECYKITYDVETKMGIKISSSAIQWFSKDKGNVKIETYDKKGKLLGSTILTEFHP